MNKLFILLVIMCLSCSDAGMTQENSNISLAYEDLGKNRLITDANSGNSFQNSFHIMDTGPKLNLVINDGISDDICYFQDNGWKMEKIEPHSYINLNISYYSHDHSLTDYMIFLDKNGSVIKKLPIIDNNRLYTKEEFDLSFTENANSYNKDQYILFPNDNTNPSKGYVGSYHFNYQPQHDILTWKMISDNRFLRIRSKSVLRRKKGEYSKFTDDVMLEYFEIRNDTLISTKAIKQEVGKFSLYKDGAVIYGLGRNNLLKDLVLNICSNEVETIELKDWNVDDSIMNITFSSLFISQIDKEKIVIVGSRESENQIIKEDYLSYDKKVIEEYFQKNAYTNSQDWLILNIYFKDKKMELESFPFDNSLVYSINKWKTKIKNTSSYGHSPILFGRGKRDEIAENFDGYRVGYGLFDNFDNKKLIASECLITLNSPSTIKISLSPSFVPSLRSGFLVNNWHLSDVLNPSKNDSIYISRLIRSKPFFVRDIEMYYNGRYKGNSNFETCLLPYKKGREFKRYLWDDLFLKRDSVFKVETMKLISNYHELVPQNNAPGINNGADIFSDGFDRVIIEGNNIQTAILPNLNRIESLESTYTKSGDIIVQYIGLVHDDYNFGIKTKEQKENWNSKTRLDKLNLDYYFLEGEEIPFLTFFEPFGIKNLYYYSNPNKKRSQAIYLTDSISCLKVDENKYLSKFEYDGQKHSFNIHVFCENFKKNYERKNEVVNFSLLGVEGFFGIYCHKTKELILNSGELFSNINSLSEAKDQTVKRYLELRYFNTTTII